MRMSIIRSCDNSIMKGFCKIFGKRSSYYNTVSVELAVLMITNDIIYVYDMRYEFDSIFCDVIRDVNRTVNNGYETERTIFFVGKNGVRRIMNDGDERKKKK